MEPNGTEWNRMEPNGTEWNRMEPAPLFYHYNITDNKNHII